MSEEEEEIEDGEGEGEGAEESSRGGKKKLIIIIAAVVLLLAGGGGGAFFFLSGDKEPEVVVIPPGPPVFHEFPLLMVDLKKVGARTNYIKVKVVAEIVTRDLPVLKEQELKIMDQIQTYLRSETRKDVSGSAGTEKMRFDIEAIVNNVLSPIEVENVPGPIKVESVLFREILLQ